MVRVKMDRAWREFVYSDNVKTKNRKRMVGDYGEKVWEPENMSSTLTPTPSIAPVRPLTLVPYCNSPVHKTTSNKIKQQR